MKTTSDVGATLKRMLKEHGVEHEEAARRAGIGIKKLYRILKGTTRLTEKLASKLATTCGLKDQTRDDLLALVRESHNKGFQAPPALKALGTFIVAQRQSLGMTMVELAKECDLLQPNLSNIETGKSAPNPRTAARLATKLKLSSAASAEFFRLLGNAMPSDAAKFTSCPPLVALMEWTALKHGLSGNGSVGESLPEDVAGKLKTAMASAARSLDQGGKDVPYAVIKKNDGSTALIVPVVISF